MRIAVFSAKAFDRQALDSANARHGHTLSFIEDALTVESAAQAAGCEAVCPFVSDRVDEPVIAALAAAGVRLITLRSAGYDHVDLQAAARRGILVAHVPAYSPGAIAEHAVALLLSLARGVHRAWGRVLVGDFSLEGLVGFELGGKTVGVVGTGHIGAAFARIMLGFGCRVVAHDLRPSDEVSALGVAYLALPDLLAVSDVVSLHVPLDPTTRHLVDDRAIARLKVGVTLINTSRGGVLDTAAAIRGLESGRIGALGLDVYEGEAGLFFADRSDAPIRDGTFARLLTFPNVLVTGHQGFLTREALAGIAEATLGNATAFAGGEGTLYRVG